MTDLDAFLDSYQPRTVTVPICREASLLDEHARLEAQAQAEIGSLAGPSRAAELAALEVRIEEASTPFVFRALSRKAWADLLKAHPPSKEDLKARVDFNPDTFPHAAIAACSVDPDITEAQAVRLGEVLPQGEWEKCWAAVLTCNVEEVTPPKSLLAAVARTMSNGSSTTASPTGSLGASS